MAKSKNTTPFTFNTYGSVFNGIPVDQIRKRLVSEDGKDFGEVSLYAYEAVESGNLDSYKPKNSKEKSILSNFRKHQGYTLSTENGTNFGKVSYDAYSAIINGNLDKYKPVNASEKKAIDEYKDTLGYGKTGISVKKQYNKNKFGKGNIDLTKRPVYTNKDGSISTVSSMSIEEDGKEVLIPTIVWQNGKAKKLTEEEAIEHYHKTGEHLGKFNSINEANKYATKLHVEQELYYDFKLNSKYKSSANGKKPTTTTFQPFGGNAFGTNAAELPYYYETGFDDIEHDYINRNPDAIERMSNNEFNENKYLIGSESEYLKTMTQDEIDSYNYIYNKYGKEKAEEFIESLTANLNARYRKSIEDSLRDFTSKNGWNAALASAGTVAISPMKISSAIGQTIDYLDDGKLDPNAGYNKYVYGTNTVRSTTSKMIGDSRAGGIGSGLYNIGMSIGDSAVNTAATGGIKPLSLGTMGAGAFASGVVNAKDRGLSDNQAMGLGVVAAAAEIITESFSFDKLMAAKNIGKTAGKAAGKSAKTSVAKYIADNMKTNALEELGAEGINFVADLVIAQDKSELITKVNDYKKAGKSDSQAWTSAFKDTAVQFALAGIGGALSGGVMSGAAAPMVNKQITNIGKSNANDVLDVIEEGLSFDKNSEAYKNAVQLFKNKTDTDYYAIGQQVLLNNVQSVNNAISEGLQYDKNSQAYQNAVKLSKSNNVTGQDIAIQLALNEQAKQGTDSWRVAVGDVFKDSKTGNVMTVVDRNAKKTTVEINTGNRVTTKKLSNRKFASFLNSEQLQRLGTVETTVDERAKSEDIDGFYDEGTDVDNAPVDVGSAPIDIGDNPADVNNVPMDEAIKSDDTDNVYDETTDVSIPEETSAPSTAARNINLTRVGNHYEIYGEEAVALASDLGIETTTKLVNGVETETISIPVNMAQNLADSISDDFNLVINDGTVETSSNVTEAEVAEVVLAMDETFKPGAKEQLQKLKAVSGDISLFAKKCIEYYEQNGTLDSLGGFFNDGGKKVTSAIESALGISNDIAVTETAEDVQKTDESDVSEAEAPVGETTPEVTEEVVAENTTATNEDIETADESRETIEAPSVESEVTETTSEESDNELDKSSKNKNLANNLANDLDNSMETKEASEPKSYVSGNNGRTDGAVVNETGNNNVVKAIDRDKSDVAKATTEIAGQTIEMDKPVEIVYVPNANGTSVYGAYFSQTQDSRGGQIASIKSVEGNQGFDSIYDMDFMNETGFMENINGQSETATTRISKTSFEGNPEVVKQLLNQVFENVTKTGIRGQITFTMDDIDVNNFNDISCALFSEVSKYLPDSIKSKLGFKSQSFSKLPRYIHFGGVNSSVNTGNAINIDTVDTASGKYVDVINELMSMDEAQRNQVLKNVTQMPATVEQLRVVAENSAKMEQATAPSTTAETKVSDAKVLKNEPKSDTMESTTVNELVEREANGNESIRTGLLHENGKRRNDESTRKQTGRVLSSERKNESRNETERRNFARELIERGQVEEITLGNNTFSLVKKEAYNDDMLSLVEYGKEKGVEVEFFVGDGTAQITLENGDKVTRTFDGIKTSPTQIYLQYDSNKSPQTLFKHEECHAKWKTASMQKAKDKIFKSLSEEEKQEILSRQRYKAYAEAYKNDMNAVWEEFICDVMSGMIDYANNFTDVVNEYWNNNETAEGYNPADYASSKDAGGDARYSVYDYPRLNNSEWTLLNNRLKIEIGNDDNFIDKYTKWLYASKNGTRVFAIYGIGWGNDATPLLAVGGSRADSYKKGIERYLEGKNNGSNRSRTGIDRRIKSLLANRGKTSDNLPKNGNGRTKVGNGTIYNKQRGSNGKGIDVGSTKNSNGVNYSLKDSVGNNLTEAQQEYFKDSKVRDENGNLRVMYQGSAEDFTVFDRKKSSYANLYGRGFYFTDSEAHAKQYGNSKAYYLNIKNPVSTKETTITKQQLHKFLEAVSENEDYSFENYGYGATIDGVVEDVYGKSDFLMLYDINQTAIGDLVEAVELFNEVNGTSFDGLILDTETVTFNSEQAKLTSNEVPTSNPDTRYSFTEDYNKSSSNSKRMSSTASENRINELKTEIANIEEELETTFDDADERKLQNKLFKLRHDLDELIAAERRATVKTPIPTIIENLGKYRLSDLHSLAEQVSDNNWDDYEDLSREELESALKETLEARLDDLAPEDASNKKYGFNVRPVQEKGKVVEFRPKSKGGNNGVRYSLSENDDEYAKLREMQMEIIELSKKIGEIEDSDTHKALFDKVVNSLSKDNSDKAIAEYNKFAEESGLINAIERQKELQNELNQFQKNLQKAREQKAIADEQKAIEKSGMSEADYFRKQAVKEFGYTPFFYDAGYITPNGKMLNFSGEKGQHFGSRGQDHRAIGTIYAGVDGTKAMVKFMSEGNVRIMAESPGIDIASSIKPTSEQYSTIKKFVREYANKEYFNIDFTDENGQTIANYEYEGRIYAERVVNDIKYYFENGTTREQSSVSSFRYDISEEQDSKYMRAVENGDTETASKMIEEAAEKAFANSKVRGDDGKLKLVYHGRVSDFNVFDRSFANVEGDFGKGYYFTSNEYDVDANYANEEGPDLKIKISRLAEKLEWDDEYADLSYDEREEIARQRLVTSEPSVITAYLNMENPVYITPDENGTLLDYNESYDEEYDEYGEPEGLLIDFIEALNNIASDYSYGDVDFNFLYEYAYENGGVYASDAVKTIKHRIVDELTDENGDLAVNEVIRLAFEEIGFDGIIDTSVYFKFNNMDGMDSGTTHYIVFDSEQIKSADIATYDDNGNIIPLSQRFNESNEDIRYNLAKNDLPDALETQKLLESIAKDIGTHEELIEAAKQNTKEFASKIKENKSLQKRLKNAKRQMLVSPNPAVNIAKAGKITKEILSEMESTLKASDLKDDVMGIYGEYLQAIKKSGGVTEKVQQANENMVEQFTRLAVDIAENAESFVVSEEYNLIKSYIQETPIKIPDDAKADMHYAEFRKSHKGTFNLTNDGLPVDTVYQELCGMFPGMFDESITHPADQILAIADKLDRLKPYAYNPHEDFMHEAVEHIVYKFVSEADGIAVSTKTKAQKMIEKAEYDKAKALDKEKAEFERKLDKEKKRSEDTIQKLQKKIDDAKYVKYWEKRLGKEESLYKEREKFNRKLEKEKERNEKNTQKLQKVIDEAKYVRYWEKRLSKEEKAQAIKEVRDRQKVAVLKSKIRNIVSNMKKNIDKSEKTGGYPKELVKVAAEVCSALDFHTGKTNKDGSPTKASLRLDTLMAEYNALKNNENYDFASEYRQELSDKINDLYQAVKDKRVVDLNLNELSDLKDILSEISHSLSIASKQIGKANAKANAELAQGIIDSLEAMDDLNNTNKRLFMRENKLEMQSAKAFILNPHRINEMIAGYDTNSVWWQLHEDINRGNRKAAKFVMEANKPFDELVDGGGNEIAFYDFRTKKIKTGIKYTDGSEVEIPKSIICEMMMMWNRKDGRTHLETGGAKIPDMELYNKGKTTDAVKGGKRTNPITMNDMVRLRGLLDSYDLAWIERAHHLFNKVSQDAINSTSMELVGRELARGKNYIRMYVDSDFIGKEVGKEENNITLEGHGSLKETKPKAKQPLIFRGLHENIYDNIDFASKYYGLAIPIRNFNKVYRMTFRDDNGQSSVKEVIGKKFGAKIQIGVVEQYIKDLQTPRQKEYSKFDTFKGKWLGATFWGNISSALKQTSSYWTGAALLGENSLAKGLTEFAKHPGRTKAEISKYSGTLYKRSQGLSTTELGDRANRNRLAGASSKVTKVINKTAPWLRQIPEGIRPGNWLQAMDVNTSAALWEACKIEVSKSIKSSDEGYMQAVTDLWERVIEETQSNYDVAHRPESLKSTNPITQTVTMFTTDAQQKFGVLFSSYNDYVTKSGLYKKDSSEANETAKKEAGTRLAKASRSIVYSALWMGFVSVIANAVLRKFKPYIDEEEKDITAGSVAEQYVKFVGEDLFNSILPVGSSLILQAADTFSNGYDFVSVPSFDVVEDFIVSLSKVYKAATNDEKGDVPKALLDSAYAISNFTGVPAKNITDIVKSIKGYAGDIKAGDFAHDIEDYTNGNKSFYSYGDLASYITTGNKEKEQKLLDYYSANGKEISKGSLTKEIKPAYVQMCVDSPEKANAIKRKLILEYDYTEDAINKWIAEEYINNVDIDPEYAEEIKSATQSDIGWDDDSIYKTIKSNYKKAYKKGDKQEIKNLKDALLNSSDIHKGDISDWESEADEEIAEKEEKQKAEKEKYK